jgi:hypothetical protein
MPMTIGVAIPCYRPHHSFLNRLFDSIAAQTRRPDRVVVSCSSWSSDDVRNLMVHDIPVTIVYARRRILQAENRNIAARLLGTRILTFIDADDIMHPRRLEYVLRAFQETNCDGVVHNYQYVDHSAPVPYETEDEYRCDEHLVKKDPAGVGCMIEGNHPLHHAQLSITRNVFSRFQYPTEEQYYRMEDSVYLATLVQNGVAIRYLHNKLSQYFHS